MSLRFVNIGLLLHLLALTASGGYLLIWPGPALVMDVHRVAGWAFIALLPWKTIISLRSLRRGLRPDFDRSVVIVISLALAAATIVTLLLAIDWSWDLGSWVITAGFTSINLHWLLALLLAPPLALHLWRRWPRPRRADIASRRGVLRLAGLGLAGALLWRLSDDFGKAVLEAESTRPETGSRLRGTFSGNEFPVTTNPGAGTAPIEAADWALRVEGAVGQPLGLNHDQILSLPPAEWVATIDCTVGWYSRQRWQGIPLSELLDLAGASPRARHVRFESVSDYAKTLPIHEARQVLLATHVGGEPLSHDHGFPLRAVVPSRRGWFWVKWLSRLVVLKAPAA